MSKGIVTAGHTMTAQAAIETLESGGNAFDAAVAALMASFVTEPCMSSAGGGGFMCAHTEGGRPLLYDFFCQTPQRKLINREVDFYPVEVVFESFTEIFHIGMGSVAVPGMVAGLFAMHRDLCSLPLKELAAPALRYARQGVIVDDFQHFDFELLRPILEAGGKESEAFFRDGNILAEGERIFLPQMGDFLEQLVREGEESFYKGDAAAMLIKDCRERGGFLSDVDMAHFRVRKTQPLPFRYRGKQIYTTPLPGTGGAMLALLLDEIAQKEKSSYDDLAQALAHSDQLEKIPSVLEKALRSQLGVSAEGAEAGHPDSKMWGSTTHFNVADDRGNAVSISVSNGEGSGYFLHGTQVQLNNMLGEAALLPGGFHSWEENVRLSSMMSPTIVADTKGKAEIVLGTGGAGRIPGAIAQVLRFLIEENKSPSEAVNSSRMHVQEGILNMEPDIPELDNSPVDEEKVVHWDSQSMYFGGVHVLQRGPGGWQGAGDQRRSGVMKSTRKTE